MLRQELAGCNALHRGGLGQLVVVASISTMQKHGQWVLGGRSLSGQLLQDLSLRVQQSFQGRRLCRPGLG